MPHKSSIMWKKGAGLQDTLKLNHVSKATNALNMIPLAKDVYIVANIIIMSKFMGTNPKKLETAYKEEAK